MVVLMNTDKKEKRRIFYDVKESRKIYECKVSVRPVAHHYEEKGEKPYIKWGCPICDSIMGKHHSVSENSENCPICGINLIWEEDR